jgi:L-alanine-DL-glutamate epimerase-like enolase superfamily enzyme
VQDLGGKLIGKDPTASRSTTSTCIGRRARRRTARRSRRSPGIELALWDLAGKSLGVPVWRLMGGPHRERQRVYWSHCATYRVENAELFRVKPLRSMADVADCAREASDKGYTAFKTNIIWPAIRRAASARAARSA